MNFEQAKRLQEAGFPQASAFYEGRDAWVDPENRHCNSTFSDAIYCPPLSELIYECGSDFHALNHMGETTPKWMAIAYSPNLLVGNGDTPEDAVTNLWLQLNKR